MRIRWTIPAIRNIAHIQAYISADNPAAAERIVGRIDKVVGHLASHPQLGRPGQVRETRELKIARTPYLVVYRLHARRIDILAVFHDRQQRPTSYPRAH